MGMGGAGGGDDFGAGGIRLAVGDVLGNGAKEQERLLQHQADVAAIFGHRDGADINAINENSAFADIVKTADQIDQGRFARAAMADQAHHLARFDDQIDVAGHGASPVAEACLLERNAAFDLTQMHRAAGFRHGRNMIENVKNALGPGGGLLRHRHNPAHRIQAGVEAANVSEESSQHANRDVALGNLPDAETPDHQQANFRHQRDRGRKQRPGAIEFVVQRQIELVGLLEAPGLALLLGKGLDDPDAGNGVGQHVGDFRPDPVDLLETGAQTVANGVDQVGDEGQREQGHQG